MKTIAHFIRFCFALFSICIIFVCKLLDIHDNADKSLWYARA